MPTGADGLQARKTNAAESETAERNETIRGAAMITG
jgi:hypothetical protein